MPSHPYQFDEDAHRIMDILKEKVPGKDKKHQPSGSTIIKWMYDRLPKNENEILFTHFDNLRGELAPFIGKDKALQLTEVLRIIIMKSQARPELIDIIIEQLTETYESLRATEEIPNEPQTPDGQDPGQSH
jgi:hypothetical protein